VNNATRPSLLRLLLVRIGVVVLALLLAGGAVTYVIARHYSDEVHDRWLYDSARTLAAQVHFASERPALDLPEVALEMFVWDEKDRIYYEVLSDRRGRIAGNAHFAAALAPRGEAGIRFFDTSLEGRAVRAVTVALRSPAQGESIRVIVGETLNKRTMLAGEILLATIPVQLLLILAGAFALWWALRRGLIGVSAATAAIRARDPCDLGPVALPKPAPAEIEPLIGAINDLIIRVDQAQRAQRRFVANAAHQLRTPVTTLQVQVERALRERDPEERATALAHVDVAVKRVSHLLHKILALARAAPDRPDALAFAPCDLADAAMRAVETRVDEALSRGRDLGYAAPSSPVIVEADATMLDELLANLIENALQYGGRHITVGVADDPPGLYVEDDGPGISRSEREKVWERFYRIPGSPGFGCGLGLPIVREIADRHGASLSLDSAADGTGTRVTIVFTGSSRSRYVDAGRLSAAA
jgi:two-component system sensor histidine kinase TctE